MTLARSSSASETRPPRGGSTPGVSAPDRVDGIRSYFEGRSGRWIRLTSADPVSGVRARVRAGRARMADTLLEWVSGAEPGSTILDAGCGPGEITLRLAEARMVVTGVEVAPSLVQTARERAAEHPQGGQVRIEEGDASRAPGGPWDQALVMDVLFHYPEAEAVEFLARLAGQVQSRIVFTVGPRTLVLGTLRRMGELFPKADRASGLHLVRPRDFGEAVLAHPSFRGWELGRSRRVTVPFYASHGIELVRVDGGQT